MIRLLASDIDGTLLPRKDMDLSSELFELIRKMRERNTFFFAASGRQYQNLRMLFDPVKDEIGYICANGCLAYYDGELVHKETMSYDIGQEIISAISEYPGDEVMISGEQVTYIDGKNEEFLHEMRDVVRNKVYVPENILDTPEEYFKISAYRKEGAAQHAQYYERLFGDRVTVVYGGGGYVDMMPRNVNKGTTIQWIMDFLGIKKSETCAFGDNYNDEEMLNDVEYGFAMKKAPKEIRDFAYGVTEDVIGTMKTLFAEGLL